MPQLLAQENRVRELEAQLLAQENRVRELEAQLLAQENKVRVVEVNQSNPGVVKVKYIVTAMKPTDNCLDTPLENPLPVVGSIIMDPIISPNTFDHRITPSISVWLAGYLAEGEEGQIFRNDGLLYTLKHLSGMNGMSRNKHEDSTNASLRSDCTLLHDGVPLINVEEKDLVQADAKTDLSRKFRWIPHFHKLPFIYGIAITKFHFSVYKLLPDTSITLIWNASIDDIENRIECLRVCVNIARVIKYYIENEMFVTSSLSFDTWYNRTRKKIKLTTDYFEVEYSDRDTYNRLKMFYEDTRNVLNMEHPITTIKAFDDRYRRIRLVPVGIHITPGQTGGLVKVIKDISTCIEGIHAKNYVHCDIRWANIIYYQTSWVLIDCEFVTNLNDTLLLSQRSTDIRSEYVRNNSKPWCPLFDWYQLGMLLNDKIDLTQNDTRLMQLMNELLDKSTNEEAIVNYKKMISKL